MLNTIETSGNSWSVTIYTIPSFHFSTSPQMVKGRELPAANGQMATLDIQVQPVSSAQMFIWLLAYT